MATSGRSLSTHGKDLWDTPGLELPRPVRKVARALMKKRGFTKSRAIATAVSRGKRWAAKGNKTWIRAMAQWEAARAKAKAHPNKGADLAHLLVLTEPTPAPREVLMASDWKKKSGKGGPPNKGGRKIESVGDVTRAVQAVEKLPPALQKKAQKRVVGAARRIGGAAMSKIPDSWTSGGGEK